MQVPIHFDLISSARARVYVFVSVCICMYVCVYVSMQAYLSMQAYVCINACMHVCRKHVRVEKGCEQNSRKKEIVDIAEMSNSKT